MSKIIYASRTTYPGADAPSTHFHVSRESALNYLGKCDNGEVVEYSAPNDTIVKEMDTWDDLLYRNADILMLYDYDCIDEI